MVVELTSDRAFSKDVTQDFLVARDAGGRLSGQPAGWLRLLLAYYNTTKRQVGKDPG